MQSVIASMRRYTTALPGRVSVRADASLPLVLELEPEPAPDDPQPASSAATSIASQTFPTFLTLNSERHRSRTCLASGCDAVLVLKTSWGTGPGRSAAQGNYTGSPSSTRSRQAGCPAGFTEVMYPRTSCAGSV